MRLGRFIGMVALVGALGLALGGCDRGNQVTVITATPVCPVAANAVTASGTVTAFNAASVTLTTATNGTIVARYVKTTRFNRLAPLASALKAGMTVQVLVQPMPSGIPTALTVIQQPTTGTQTTCTASQGGVPGVLGTVAAVRSDGGQFTLTDANGKQYLLALTAATSLSQLATATAGDIAVGERVLLSGTRHGASIDAGQLVIATNAIAGADLSSTTTAGAL